MNDHQNGKGFQNNVGCEFAQQTPRVRNFEAEGRILENLAALLAAFPSEALPIEVVRPALLGATHELRVNVPGEPLLLEADPTRLAQVFANLLDNAIKYTPRGGRICVDARRENDQLCVSVADNGTGIRKEMLPRVFDLFMQADRTLQRSGGGLGIGLTLVRKLVELHGGSVEALSAGENQGRDVRKLAEGFTPSQHRND